MKNDEHWVWVESKHVNIKLEKSPDFIKALSISEGRIRELLLLVKKEFELAIVDEEYRGEVFQRLSENAASKNEFAFLCFWFGRKVDAWMCRIDSEVVPDGEEYERFRDVAQEIYLEGVLDVCSSFWSSGNTQISKVILACFTSQGDLDCIHRLISKYPRYKEIKSFILKNNGMLGL